MRCAGCVGAHLPSQIRKPIVMLWSRTAISRSVKEKKKHRLLVDVQDQLPRRRRQKPCERGLRQASAANIQTACATWPGKCCLHARRTSAAAASTCHASNQGWPVQGGHLDDELVARTWPLSLETSWRKSQVPLDFWPFRPSPAMDLVFRAKL